MENLYFHLRCNLKENNHGIPENGSDFQQASAFLIYEHCQTFISYLSLQTLLSIGKREVGWIDLMSNGGLRKVHYVHLEIAFICANACCMNREKGSSFKTELVWLSQHATFHTGKASGEHSLLSLNFIDQLPGSTRLCRRLFIEVEDFLLQGSRRKRAAQSFSCLSSTTTESVLKSFPCQQKLEIIVICESLPATRRAATQGKKFIFCHQHCMHCAFRKWRILSY